MVNLKIKDGFSLIEIVIVLALIGIVIGIGGGFSLLTNQAQKLEISGNIIQSELRLLRSKAVNGDNLVCIPNIVEKYSAEIYKNKVLFLAKCSGSSEIRTIKSYIFPSGISTNIETKSLIEFDKNGSIPLEQSFNLISSTGSKKISINKLGIVMMSQLDE